MRLRFSPRAAADIQHISTYLRHRSPSGSSNVRDAIYKTLVVITAHPFAGRSIDRGLRKHGVGRFPYAIYYRVDERRELIEVVSVRHAARDTFRP